MAGDPASLPHHGSGRSGCWSPPKSRGQRWRSHPAELIWNPKRQTLHPKPRTVFFHGICVANLCATMSQNSPLLRQDRPESWAMDFQVILHCIVMHSLSYHITSYTNRSIPKPHPVLYYTLLYSALLYSTSPYSTLLYPTLLYDAILYYTILYYTILYCTILYYTIPYHAMLYYTRL